MFLRYPRLPRSVADQRAKELAVNETAAVYTLSDSQATPVETGSVITDHQLEELRNKLQKATRGFPEALRSSQVAEWDAAVGQTLYEHMQIAPADASHVDTWSFITLLVLPDFAVWRYPNRPKMRLLGTHRNVFRRVWWRHHVLGGLAVPQGSRPLGEDELVNIFERSRMARDHRLARVIAEEIVNYKGTGRSVFARKLTLKVRALTGSMLLDIFSSEVLRELVADVSTQIARREAEQQLLIGIEPDLDLGNLDYEP